VAPRSVELSMSRIALGDQAIQRGMLSEGEEPQPTNARAGVPSNSVVAGY
jgi:hypothetical protein